MIAQPTLALTPGEPAGIGPDIFLQYWHDVGQHDTSMALRIFADKNMLRARAEQLGIPTESMQTLSVHHIPCRTPVIPGKLDVDNAHYVLACLSAATQACLEHTCDALVTGPVHKGVINEAGIPFSGHTEFLANRCGIEQPVMLLMTSSLKVALVTTHLPLADVPQALTASRLRHCLITLHDALASQFQHPSPKLLVCGLNPHAGEGGHLGKEEQTIIAPVITQLQQQGLHITGPVSADTAFVPAQLKQFDAIVTMYHDQGLPVLKHSGFGEAINVTLGLPIVRTSVDHGTALPLAGTGQADWTSLKMAIHTAKELANAHVSTSQAA